MINFCCKKSQYLFLMVVLCAINIHSQNPKINSDSISRFSFNKIKSLFDEAKIKEPYAKAYLKKAKESKDERKLLEAYEIMSSYGSRNHRGVYIDSMLLFKDQFNDNDFPGNTFIRKAQVLGYNTKFPEAMKTLVIASTYANNNIKQQLKIKYLIGLLKVQLGEFSEGITNFKEIDSFYDAIKGSPKYDSRDHIRSLFGISYGNIWLKDYDSSRKAEKKGIRLIDKKKDSALYYNFLLLSARTSYYRKEYKASLDSLKKYQRISNSKTDYGLTIQSELFFGHIDYDYERYDKAKSHYKVADSLMFSKKLFHPEYRSAIEKLIQIEKKQGNLKQQLYYMDRLIYNDSVLGETYRNVLTTMNKKYTTPRLLEEKENIIRSFENKYNKTTYLTISISILLMVSMFYLLYTYKKKKLYRERFELLMKENKTFKLQSVSTLTEKKSFTLASDIELDLLNKLDQFEKNKQFLNNSLKLNTLSKKFETNTRYLSAVINNLKSKSFQNYINELRVNYAIDRLKSEEKFRNYTISAIAKESGFNTSQAFTNSFKKITGINPSFFLKSLEDKY